LIAARRARSTCPRAVLVPRLRQRPAQHDNTSLFQFSGGFTSAWNDGNSIFTITAIPEPSTYVAAIGLLALMLWPSRRRLIKDARSIFGLRAPMRDRLAGKA